MKSGQYILNEINKDIDRVNKGLEVYKEDYAKGNTEIYSRYLYQWNVLYDLRKRIFTMDEIDCKKVGIIERVKA